MRIFLVRHGDADAEIPEGLGDEARALTVRARAQLMTHFTQLAERMGPLNAVFTSPLVRTVQTAQTLAIAQNYEGSLRVHRSLLPDMPVGALETLLQEHVGQNIVVVGHQPSMGAVATHLLALSAFPKAVAPGTVIAVERDDAVTPPGPARLLFYAAPGHSVVEGAEALR
ncbi:MAG: SixA phosphatase family protein [Myxococcaceae bacterium]